MKKHITYILFSVVIFSLALFHYYTKSDLLAQIITLQNQVSWLEMDNDALEEEIKYLKKNNIREQYILDLEAENDYLWGNVPGDLEKEWREKLKNSE